MFTDSRGFVSYLQGLAARLQDLLGSLPNELHDPIIFAASQVAN